MTAMIVREVVSFLFACALFYVLIVFSAAFFD